MRPQRKVVTVLEVLDLCNQLSAQLDGRRGRQDWSRLPWFVDRSVQQFSVPRTVACADRRIHFGRSLNQNIRGVDIVFPGNADQREQRAATDIGPGAPVS
jgi:hypothetical protein